MAHTEKNLVYSLDLAAFLTKFQEILFFGAVYEYTNLFTWRPLKVVNQFGANTIAKHIMRFLIYPVIIGVIAIFIKMAQYIDRDAVEIFLSEKAFPYRGCFYYHYSLLNLKRFIN